MAVEQKYIVFNYVTSKAEQSEVAPNYGDPNLAVQAAAQQAYAGVTSGASTLSSASVAGTTVSMLADPAAQLVSVAQANVAISAEQLNQIQQSLSGLDAVGQLPATLSNMTAHANNVLENGTRVFEAIDLTFQPDQAGTPNRCATLSDYIGSIQGKQNGALQSVTGSLNQITNALVSIPSTIIGTFTSVVTGLLTAIQTGAQQLINGAISALSSASSALFGGLGNQIQGLISSTGGMIKQVQSAIQSEIDKMSEALSNVTNNLFRLTVPNVNPCLKDVLNDSNSTNFELPPLSQAQIDLRRGEKN